MTITDNKVYAWAPWALALVIGMGTSLGLQADSKKLVEPPKDYKKKSTIETFPFPALGQEDLADAVIEGGLEPPAAGEVSTVEKDVSQVDEKIGLKDREKRTDYDYQTTTVRFNFKMPRFAPPGTTIIQSNDFNKSNRTYNGAYDVGTTSVR